MVLHRLPEILDVTVGQRNHLIYFGSLRAVVPVDELYAFKSLELAVQCSLVHFAVRVHDRQLYQLVVDLVGVISPEHVQDVKRVQQVLE